MILVVPLWTWIVCVFILTIVILMGILNSCCRTDQNNTDSSNYLKLPATTLPQSMTIHETKATQRHRDNKSRSLFNSLLTRHSPSCGLQIQQENSQLIRDEQKSEQSWALNRHPSMPSSRFHRKPNTPTFATIRRRPLPFRPVRHGVTSNVSQYSDETMLFPKQVIAIHSSLNDSSVLSAKTWIIRLGSSGFDNTTHTFFVTIEEVWDGSVCVAGPLVLRLHVNGWCNEVEVQQNVLLSLHALSYSLDKNGFSKSAYFPMTIDTSLQEATITSVQLELVHLF